MPIKDTLRDSADLVVKAVVVITALASLIFGVPAFIDSRIDQRISNPDYIRQVASHVRPSLVFDATGSILIDLGAVQYIDNITTADVHPIGSAPQFRFPSEIIVSPKQHLVHPPRISSFDAVQFEVVVERGHRFDWKYNLKWIGHSGQPPDPTRFQLDILR